MDSLRRSIRGVTPSLLREIERKECAGELTPGAAACEHAKIIASAPTAASAPFGLIVQDEFLREFSGIRGV
jgi:hypothetical protein